AQTKTVNQAGMMGMGGQGGGGNRGGGGGMMGEQDRPGSTTILKILDEGTRVSEGEPVCWLDDSAFKDELSAQLIRYAQAKSWVEQAEAALEVAKIELDQYSNGIYPQDLELIRQYHETCLLSLQQAKKNLDWEREMA